MEPRNHYPPLPQNPGSRAFRLLTLEPGESHKDLVCQLRIINPEDALSEEQLPTYDAVSYAWGNTTPDHEILLGAWQVLIRENLWQLLKHLRHSERRAVFWIDALCIDQSCYEERAAQVQMMDEIYKHARCVVVWLGLPLLDGLPAMHLVKEVAARGVGQHEKISSSDFEALSFWAHRPYWSRTWVVQEFLLAPDVVFQCGTTSLRWKCMHRFIEIIEREINDGRNQRFQDWIAFRDSPAYILMRQRAHDAKIGRPLTTLLVRNQHTLCQDPCDKVYAVLGLSEAPRQIQVSYTLDRRRLAHDVLRHSESAPKDVVRYASFLSDLLKLEARAASQSAGRGFAFPSHMKERDIWMIPGFTAGEIISSERLDGPLAVRVSEMLQRMETSTSESATTNARSEDADALITRLHKIGLDDLKTGFTFLEAISHRTWPSNSAKVAAAAVGATAFASLVTVMTSSCAHKEILIGVAYGKPKTGDKMMYFLGHPAALSVARPDARIDRWTVSGRLACVSLQRTNVMRDRVTQKVLRSFTVQSEADLTGPAERTEFRVTTTELFVLASGG